ncbi:phosphatidate cytidylyltransferase [Georgenia wangjunii]|uniref:phosphatidate cytidylyltransferase n=1 Tax=Georgenia wangjunii TaxID=3117730 RepID=UPI003D9C138B
MEPAPPRPTDPPAGRAGRNLPAAIGVGVLLGGILLASLFIRREAFVVFALVAACAALWELARAVQTRDIRLPLLPLWVGTAGVIVSAYTAGREAMLVAFLLTAGGVFVWRVLDGGGPDAVRDASAGIFAAAYVSLLAGFAVLIVAADSGPWLVLTFIGAVVANDLGGYAAGVLLGKHPLAPSISPKKSWEGLGGSVLLTCGVGVGMMAGVLDGPWWSGVVLGVAVVASATVGDLAESLLKRDLGMKDMGSILPGHGGVMDRLDSLVLTAPVCYVLFSVFLGT